MRKTPMYMLTDEAEVKRLVRRHPWATIVSNTADGMIASHYPVILDPTAPDDEFVIVSHFGKPDDRMHELAIAAQEGREVLVIIQGPHDYVSASWYPEDMVIPTWNHVTAHLYGVPEVLSDEENYRMLEALTDHFEQHYEGGKSLSMDPEGTRREAHGTAGLRVRVTRFDARAKLSQGKNDEVFARVHSEMAQANPALAAEMQRVREQGAS